MSSSTSPGCHDYSEDDKKADREAAEKSRDAVRSESPRKKVEVWCPFTDRATISMPTQDEYALGFPEGAIIHTTEGRSLQGDRNMETTLRYGREQGMAYFGISRTGKIYQTHPLNRWGFHAGKSRLGQAANLSTKFVGIELAGPGLLERVGDCYKPNWSEEFQSDEVRYLEQKGNVTKAGYYGCFSEAQEESLTMLLLWLHKQWPEVFRLENVVGHDEVAVDENGQLGRKQDPGGALSYLMADYRDYLKKQADTKALGDPISKSPMTRGGDNTIVLSRGAVEIGESVAWGTALYMAKAAQLAYVQDDNRIILTAQNDFLLHDIVVKEVSDLKWWVGSDDHKIVVSLRGTYHLITWLRNVDAVGRAISKLGPVHRGFYDAFDLLSDFVFDEIERRLRDNPDREVFLTGHSLGGAMATIAAAQCFDYRKIGGIYTFGQPRPGYSEFQKKFDKRFDGVCFRFVNEGDFVPRLPPRFVAKHVGQIVWFDPDGMPGTKVPQKYRSFETEVPPPNDEPLAMSQAEFESLLKESADETLEQNRGNMLGRQHHAIERYIQHLEEQARRQMESSNDKVECENLDTILRLNPGGSNLPRGSSGTADVPPTISVRHPNVESLLQLTDELPPVAVHVIWSPKSNSTEEPPPFGCQQIAASIFECLNHKPKTGKGNEIRALVPDLEMGVGIPVFAGHHFARVRKIVERLKDDKKPGKGPCAIVVLLIDKHGDPALGGDFGTLVDWLWEFRALDNVKVIKVRVDRWSPPLTGEDNGLVQGHEGLPDAESRLDAIARKTGILVADFLRQRPQPLGVPPGKVGVYISDSKRDDAIFKNLSNRFQALVEKEHLFFENLSALPEPEPGIASHVVMLLLRTDSISESPGVLNDLLRAKKLGIPVVTLQIMKEGGGAAIPVRGISLPWLGRPPEPTPRWSSVWKNGMKRIFSTLLVDACGRVCKPGCTTFTFWSPPRSSWPAVVLIQQPHPQG